MTMCGGQLGEWGSEENVWGVLGVPRVVPGVPGLQCAEMCVVQCRAWGAVWSWGAGMQGCMGWGGGWGVSWGEMVGARTHDTG